MIEFIINLYEFVCRWILYTVIALLVIYLFLHRLTRWFGTRNIIDEYVCMVVEWIRDAFRD